MRSDDVHWFRRLLSCVLAAAIVAAGLYYPFLVMTGRVERFYLKLMLGSGFVVFVGLFVLWIDFVLPLWRRTKG